MKYNAILCTIVLSLLTSFASAEDGQQYFAFSYFTGNGEHGLHLLVSQDGLKWDKVNGGVPLYRQTLPGDNLMRDPSICKGPDGTWHLVWTTSWKRDFIGHSTSADLIHWTPSQAIPVMAHEPTCRNTWAPEIFYDDATEQFYIFWSSTIPGRFSERGTSESSLDHRMYFVTTKDFKTFSPTKLFFNPGHNVIDGMIAKLDKTYYLFYKDERLKRPAEDGSIVEGKSIWLATAPSVEGPYTAGKIVSPMNWVEGPTAFRVNNRWMVLYDCYAAHHYGAIESADGVNWTDVTDKLSIPKEVRHGTVFEISQKEYEALKTLNNRE